MHLGSNRTFILSVFALGILAAGCGSPQAVSPTAATVAPTTSKLRTNRPRFSVAIGKITTVSSASFDLSSHKGSVTVDLVGSTKYFQTVLASESSVSVGSCLRALGPANSIGNIQARVVTISKPTSSGCSAGFGFGGGLARRSGGKRASASGSSSTGGGLPTGSGQSFSGTFGAVVSVSTSTIEVQGAQGQVGVAITPSTRIVVTQTASESVLVSGQCARAIGAKSKSATFSAESVTVSAPGPSGCAAGAFRGVRPATSPPTTA